MGLDDVAEASCWRHEHCINVCLAEEGCGSGDGWRDVDFCGLSELTLVACLYVLFNIVGNGWPPESVKEGTECGVESLVTQSVVCVVKDGAVLQWSEH